MVRTIGIAIGIPEPWGSQLDAHRAASGDPMAAAIPAHLTLLAPLEVDRSPATIATIEEHLATVAQSSPAYELRLRGTDTFRPVTQVVFVAVADGGQQCRRLAASIRCGPLEHESRFPYHPHVTVAQDVAAEALDAVAAKLADFEARFRVDGFTLYESQDGRWQPRRRFDLLPVDRSEAGLA